MLAFFQVRRTFCKFTVSVHVDCERREASACLSYDRRIVAAHVTIPFHEVATPREVDAWLSAEVPDYREQGAVISRVEGWELDFRTRARRAA